MHRRDRALALLVVGAVVGLAIAWEFQDNSPPVGDDVSLYGQALCMVDAGPTRLFSSATRCVGSTPYPPLVPMVAAFHMWALGDRSIEMAKASQWVWWALLAGMGWIGGRPAGRLAAASTAIVASGLWVLAGVRQGFFTELSVAACAFAALVALEKSEGLRSPRWSAAAGAFLSLGMLAKWTFAFFVAPPTFLFLLVAVTRATRPSLLGLAMGVPLAMTAVGVAGALLGHTSWLLPLTGVIAGVALTLPLMRTGRLPGQVAGNLGLLVAFAATALPCYAAIANRLATFLGRNVDHAFGGDVLTLTDTWRFYPAVLVVQLGLAVVIAASLGLFRQLHPSRSTLATLAALAVLSALVALTLSPYRSSRYLAPAFPLVAPLLLGLSSRVEPRLSPARALFAAPAAWLLAGWLLPLGGGSVAPHLAGNDHHALEQVDAALRSAPWVPDLWPATPFSSPARSEDFLDAAEALTRDATAPIYLLDSTPLAELKLPLLVEALRRDRPGGVVIENAPDPRAVASVIARVAPGCGPSKNLFLMEVVDERSASFEAALASAGLSPVWEHTQEPPAAPPWVLNLRGPPAAIPNAHPVEGRLRRLWGAVDATKLCLARGSGAGAFPKRI